MPFGKGTRKSSGKVVAKRRSNESSQTKPSQDDKTDDEGSITDPEMIAEAEYARNHPIRFVKNLTAGDMTSGSNSASMLGHPMNTMSLPLYGAGRQSGEFPHGQKIKHDRAEKKARNRGVSGSMSKKDRGIPFYDDDEFECMPSKRFTYNTGMHYDDFENASDEDHNDRIVRPANENNNDVNVPSRNHAEANAQHCDAFDEEDIFNFSEDDEDDGQPHP